MKIFKTTTQLQDWVEDQKRSGKIIGFVPTMGALHEGHLSLVEHSLQKKETCIVSIFVNPTQFNNPTDFKKYPRPIEADIEFLLKTGCQCLYLPFEEEIYPVHNKGTKEYNIGYLENILEGEYRPGHFKGVVQIVSILLHNVKPDVIYLGEKDYQQCMVLTEMIEKENLPVIIETLPIKREKSGLAMSSRNMRLSPNEKDKAPLIYDALNNIKKEIKPGEIEHLSNKQTKYLNNNGFKTDYLVIADASTLKTVKYWDGKSKLVALIAAYLGEVRLIDNLILS